MLDYLIPRLFEPLGIEEPTWETCPGGINTGGWGLSVPTEEIAKFGQLFLQKGSGTGRKSSPRNGWKPQPRGSLNGTTPTKTTGRRATATILALPPRAFRGDGAFGQLCIVMPEQDAVLAITSGLLGNMQGVLNLVWEHLLPATEAGVPWQPIQKRNLQLDAETLAAIPDDPRKGKPRPESRRRSPARTYMFPGQRAEARIDRDREGRQR